MAKDAWGGVPSTEVSSVLEFGHPSIKLCLHGLRRGRAGFVRELFLASPLRCRRPGGLPFCAVVIAH